MQCTKSVYKARKGRAAAALKLGSLEASFKSLLNNPCYTCPFSGEKTSAAALEAAFEDEEEAFSFGLCSSRVFFLEFSSSHVRAGSRLSRSKPARAATRPATPTKLSRMHAHLGVSGNLKFCNSLLAIVCIARAGSSSGGALALQDGFSDAKEFEEVRKKLVAGHKAFHVYVCTQL